MISRTIETKAKYLAGKFPILTVTGPRQSGKTTLIKALFKAYDYYSLEDPDERALILSDPKGFLGNIKNGIVLDEVQRMPELFSYIQTYSDNNPKIKFILSGSQNFQLLESISQSLAGRTAILKLMPLSMAELNGSKYAIASYEKTILYGGYPRIFDNAISPSDFYPNYIQTYVERDVRQVKKVQDLDLFIKFLGLCAGRIGQLLNLNSLANDAGITLNTAKAWLSVLETSYVAYTLKPFHKNFNKRLVKMPKLYFYDTGLACAVLGIENEKQVATYHNKGSLFENLILNELLKQRYNTGQRNNLFFWRNNHGNEVDCLMGDLEDPLAIEMKSGATITPEHFKGLGYWNKVSGSSPDRSFLIYTGNRIQKTKWGTMIPWNKLHEIPGR